MPLKGTTEEDYYVSQDELWEEWEDGYGSVSTHSEAHTEFTYCLDSTDEDGKKKDSSEDVKKRENLAEVNKIKRKTKTIFSLDLGQYDTKPKSVKSLEPAAPEFFGGFGDSQVIEKDVSLKKSSKVKDDTGDSHQCKVHLPYKSSSSLILLQKEQHDTLFTSPAQGSPELIGPYFNTFLLDNPTSSKVAFKIYCNSAAWHHFTVRPAFGVIPANGRFSVRITRNLKGTS